MLQSYTAKYTRVDRGYMGQLVEWPEVVTEGADLEECRVMLRDALNEMLVAYRELGKEIPTGNALLEQMSVELDRVGKTA
jgi:predicted RNase H-like HicB family nuclease